MLDRPVGLGALPLPRFRIVLEDDIRVTVCREGPLTGVPGMLSLRGRGESLRMDKDEGTRACVPAPDVVRRTISARNGLSAPGCGDGVGESRAAAMALRICARSWELWRSVRYATCWRRKSTVTWNRDALWERRELN